jgi:hypothetical protein
MGEEWDIGPISGRDLPQPEGRVKRGRATFSWDRVAAVRLGRLSASRPHSLCDGGSCKRAAETLLRKINFLRHFSRFLTPCGAVNMVRAVLRGG